MISINKRLLILISIILVFLLIVVVMVIPPDDSTLDDDFDGYMNNVDEFPNDSSEWNDSDGDGVGDNQDQFPFDPAASVDSDDDGYPDKWNPGKTASDSNSSPPLLLDDLPFDPDEFRDSDGDGFGDNTDVFPDDENEWSDDDNDGIGGNADINPLVNLSFQVSIDSCLFSRNVDILPWAQVYFVVTIDDDTMVFDNGGSFWRLWKNRQTSIGVVFSLDIADDIMYGFTDIEISMFDADYFFEDDKIDINPDNGQSSVHLRYNHLTNNVSGTGVSEGEKGKIWYIVSLPSEVKSSNLIIDKSYQFSYNGSEYMVSLNIPRRSYTWYQNLSTNRSPQRLNDEKAIAAFVTSDDLIIQKLASQLFSLASSEGFSEIETINFVLSFVQHAIPYEDDNVTAGCVEYWRYPIESLVDETGDCEDSTLLFASIMENRGIETVLLFYVLDEQNGHLASAVHLDENIPGTSIKYNDQFFYYAETTDIGFTLGQKPSSIPDDPEMIIDLE